jgi:hypothetical protein
MSKRFIRERLEDPDSKKAEALSWLEGSAGKNTLGELSSTGESILLVKEAYDAGAVEVLAIEIDEYESGQENTGKLILKLPSEAELRKRVFQWCADQAEAQGYEGEKDEGQTHIFVSLD